MFNLDDFRMGYVILYRNTGGKFGDNIVRKQIEMGFSQDQAKYTHVETSGGGRHSVNIAPPISKLVDITQKHKGREIRLVRYKNDDYEKKGRYKVAYFSATLNNTGYDIMGILRFAFKWIKAQNRLWFCSEGSCWALQKEYPQALQGMKPSECVPAHFTSSEFETVFEGKIPT